MRLIVMGTGPFAVPMFEALLASAHEVAALITRPTPPARGRQKQPPNPMADVARGHGGLPVLDPPDVNAAEAQAALAELRPELFVVCDYGQILSAATLAIPRLGGINLHASLLPAYRGAAPIHWAIYDGCRETGVTVIHMTPRLDGGPCLVQIATPIEPPETAADLEQRLARLGIAAVLSAIEMLSGWDGQSPLGRLQDQALATKAPRLKKSDGHIDWTRSAEQIGNQVRAFQPWPGSFTSVQTAAGQTLRLILDRVSVSDQPPPADAVPGQVLAADARQFLVATGGGVLAIERLQPEGKRAMTSAEFLRGHALAPAAMLG